jgi:hypothetical protein
VALQLPLKENKPSISEYEENRRENGQPEANVGAGESLFGFGAFFNLNT